MATSLNDNKVNLLDKALDFQFLLLMLCSMVFINSFCIVVSGNNLLSVSTDIFSNEVSFGQISIGFATFSFLMAVIFPILCGLLRQSVGHNVESLLLAIMSKKRLSETNHPGWYSENDIQLRAIKYKSSFLEKLLTEQRELRNKQDKGAKLAFSFGALLFLDLVIAFTYGGYDLSFVHNIGSLATKLPTMLSRATQFILWTFSTVLFIYALMIRSDERYIYVQDDILKAIEGK